MIKYIVVTEILKECIGSNSKMDKITKEIMAALLSPEECWDYEMQLGFNNVVSSVINTMQLIQIA